MPKELMVAIDLFVNHVGSLLTYFLFFMSFVSMNLTHFNMKNLRTNRSQISLGLGLRCSCFFHCRLFSVRNSNYFLLSSWFHQWFFWRESNLGNDSDSRVSDNLSLEVCRTQHLYLVKPCRMVCLKLLYEYYQHFQNNLVCSFTASNDFPRYHLSLLSCV